MAGDRQQFRDALQAWDQLHVDQNYSLPAEQGETAILLPYDCAKHAGVSTAESFDYFSRQTLHLADTILRRSGRTPHVALNATELDLKEVLTDPAYANIVVLGKGTLSSVEAATDSGRISWLDMAKAADHLKTGFFYQLVCGGTRKNLNVPLGTFVMTDHRNVLAPVHSYVRARANMRRLMDNLPPVADQPRMDLPYIKERFPYQNYYGKTDEGIAAIDRLEQHARNGTLSAIVKKKLLSLLNQ